MANKYTLQLIYNILTHWAGHFGQWRCFHQGLQPTNILKQKNLGRLSFTKLISNQPWRDIGWLAQTCTQSAWPTPRRLVAQSCQRPSCFEAQICRAENLKSVVVNIQFLSYQTKYLGVSHKLKSTWAAEAVHQLLPHSLPPGIPRALLLSPLRQQTQGWEQGMWDLCPGLLPKKRTFLVDPRTFLLVWQWPSFSDLFHPWQMCISFFQISSFRFQFVIPNLM